jgi:methyl-accepting chemotaxis protein
MERSAELLKIASAWQGDVRQNSARSLAVAYSDGTAMLDFFKESMAATTRETNAKQSAFFEKVRNPQSKQLADKVVDVRKVWLSTRDEVNQMKASVDNQTIQAFVQNRFIPATNAYVDAIQVLVDAEVSNVSTAEAEVKAMFLQLYQVGAALVVLAIAIAVFISRRLSRGIASGIDNARATAQRIGAGDLSQEVHITSSDEIGQLMAALRDMQNNLSGVVRTVRQGSDSVATASSEIAQGNLDLSARTESQASALEETAASMEQLGSTVSRTPTMPARPTSWPKARPAWRCKAVRWPGGGHHEGHQPIQHQDCRHHQRDRRHRLPDQYPGPQCRRRSGPRRRARPGLCRGGR